jgi:hypothetical protein
MFLRTFNIDDKLVRLNTYANNYVYELENNLNLKQILIKKSSINFNNIRATLSAVDLLNWLQPDNTQT